MSHRSSEAKHALLVRVWTGLKIAALPADRKAVTPAGPGLLRAKSYKRRRNLKRFAPFYVYIVIQHHRLWC
jgi:hypothetical protein